MSPSHKAKCYFAKCVDFPSKNIRTFICIIFFRLFSTQIKYRALFRHSREMHTRLCAAGESRFSQVWRSNVNNAKFRDSMKRNAGKKEHNAEVGTPCSDDERREGFCSSACLCSLAGSALALSTHKTPSSYYEERCWCHWKSEEVSRLIEIEKFSSCFLYLYLPVSFFLVCEK